jgi:hypothetical protein
VITISDTTFSINKSEKVQKTLPDIAKIKPEDNLTFSQHDEPSNDTSLKIKIEPGVIT